MTPRLVGVEEELLVVDPEDGQALARAGAVLGAVAEHGSPDGGEIVKELKEQQLEIDTRPCRSGEELAAELRRWRALAADAARRAGVRVAALATSPLPVCPSAVEDPRYAWLEAEYGVLAAEQLTCGSHVHVEVASREEGVGVLDRIREWLPPLLALTANSPFWQGSDTGYASYRSQAWDRWPSAGPTQVFGSVAGYHRVAEQMLGTGAILDRGMLYFDARLSEAHPTVEVRVADVCLEPEHAVLHALLVRALVETAARAWARGEPPGATRVEVLRLARWRAGRSGVSGSLVHPVTGHACPAGDVLDCLLAHVHAALRDAGDGALVSELVAGVLAGGGGAGLQRRAYERRGRLQDVVADAVRRTSVA